MNVVQQLDYVRLSYLGDKVKRGVATKAERDEFMLMLRQSNQITEQQYLEYIGNRNVEAIVNAGLAVGALALIGYVLNEWSKDK